MARSYSKNVTFNAIVEVNAAGPIDNRTVVATKSDLIASSTFGDFKYDGMPVVTRDTGKLYILADAAQSTASDYSAWIEMASDSSAKAGSSVVVNGNGISVTESIDPEDGHKIYTVSAVVPSTDKVLSVTANGIESGLSFSYNSEDRKIYLYGSVEDADHKIGEVDCSDFIKDGMLWGQKVFVATATTQTISITKGEHTESHEFTNLTVGHQYLAFCFTNGEVPTATYSWEITDLQDLVDIYTAGNGLQFNSEDDHKFEVKLDGTTLVVSAAGLKVNEEVYKVKDVDETAVAGVSVVLDGSNVKASVVPGSIAENDSDVVLGGDVWAADREVESTLIGTSSDLSSANTIHGAKKYTDEAETSANEYTDTAIDALDSSVDNGSENLVNITVSEENGVLTSITSDETALQEVLDSKQGNLEDGTYVNIVNDVVDINANQIASSIESDSSIKLPTEGAVKDYVDNSIADLDVEDAETVTISEGIVTVKTASETNGIISAGSVSGSFENGAQVNVLEGVKVNNVELTIDSEKKVNVDLTPYATNERVDEVEEIATEAIEDLDLRVDALEALYIVKSYTKIVTDSTAVDATIPNTEHHCGQYPIVQVYYKDELVNGDVKLTNDHSTVYVDWEDALAPSTENPIVIRIIG